MWEPRSWILGAALGLLAMDSVLAQEGWGTFGGPEVAARAVVLMNANTGEILFAKEPHLRLPPASTTKVLTALVAMEHLDPNARVQASAQAASTVPSRIGLHAGEMASTHDLLYGLMLKSGNDAAETLAEAAGGSVYGFASLMNSKAWSLGARNSHFMNPHGLPDEDHYSTAYDLALIFRHAMNYPMFTDIVRTRSAVLRIDSGQGPSRRCPPDRFAVGQSQQWNLVAGCPYLARLRICPLRPGAPRSGAARDRAAAHHGPSHARHHA
ncbi:MAG: D-alanyl-D-alanine carboxypeptidase [Candidatus Competibacteraceae bacterium]|nr:D-alanyl-D-alanine carboxypeptidase [Candidatus Competibacteraceae bacterium]